MLFRVRHLIYLQSESEESQPHLDGLDVIELERCAQELALPYLRIAALVRHYFFEQDLPEILDEAKEFSALANFLQLNASEAVDEAGLGVCDGLNWFTEDRREIETWCRGFHEIARFNAGEAKRLLLVNLLWKQPALLRVPKNYDVVFQFYHKRKCRHCCSIPKDPTVCLLCGTMVCLKENCCKDAQGNIKDLIY